MSQALHHDCCGGWLNYTYVFLYSPELHRAATWITGQSIYFIYDPNTGAGYDAEMRESFRFLPQTASPHN